MPRQKAMDVKHMVDGLPEDGQTSPCSDEDPSSKHRKRYYWQPWLRSLPLNMGSKADSKRTLALIPIVSLTLLVLWPLFRRIQEINEPHNPYILANMWAIPSTAPTTKRSAQLKHQAFCKSMFKNRLEAPNFVELGWTQPKSGILADMEIKRKVPRDTIPLLSDDPSIVFLMRLSGIKPLDVQQESYSVYVFKPMGAQARDIVSNELLSRNGWEELAVFIHIGQLDALARELNLPRSEIYFIDIGANLGAFTLGVAAAGFSVIAIEAMSVNQFALSMSLCANKGMAQSVTILPYALGKEKSQCSLFSEPGNALDGMLRCDQKSQDDLLSGGYIKRQVVDIVTLDELLGDWIPELEGRVGALKMDTEGFEPWVIQGGQRFFSSVRPRFMQLEVSMMNEQATNITGIEMLEELVDMGYELRRSAYSRPIRPRDIRLKEPSDAENVFLYSKSGQYSVDMEDGDELNVEKGEMKD